MALNGSGAISLSGGTTGQSIGLELGKSSTATVSLNDTDVRTLLGKSSGSISLSDAYGKSSVASYRYVRWNVTATKTAGELMQADEFKIQLNGSDVSMTSATVTSNNGGQGGEGPSNLVDNNLGTKFCSTTTSGPWTFTIDLLTAKAFNGYRWATANDVEGRDPKNWTVSVSNDGTNFTTKSTVTGYSATASRDTYVSGPWTW